MSDLEEIGRNSVLLRKAQGLSQEAAAFLADRSVSCLQSVEYGCGNTTMDTLIRIAGVFHIDPRVLGVFTRTDEEIIRELRQVPRLPVRTGGVLQICSNIVQLRKAQGWTQSQLAYFSQVSQARLRDIEHGCANATANKLQAIAGAFGLTLVQLTYLTTPVEEVLEAAYQARAVAGLTRK